MHASGSICCDKEIAFTSGQAKQLAGSQPIAGRESYTVPYSFGADDAAHLLSWNDFGRRSES